MVSSTRFRSWLAPLIAAWLALPPPGLAQEPQSSFSESIEVNLVNVHVVVITYSGKPITGLTRDDFLVWEDGEPREITHFARVLDGQPELASDPTSPEEGSSASLPANLASAGGSILPVSVFDRSIVMAFDAGIDRPYLKRAVSQSRNFVAEHAGDGIWWSVVLLGRRPFNLVPLTSDSARVVEALDELLVDLHGVRRTRSAITADVWRTGAQPRRPKLEGKWCRLPLTEQTLAPTYMAQSLSQVFRAYASVPGVKAAVVYQMGSGGSRMISVDQFMLADHLIDQWWNLSRLASSTGFTVYAMGVTGLNHPAVTAASAGGSYGTALHHSVPTTSAASFRASALAVRTGGESVQSNDLAMALKIAAQGTSTYYSLAFTAPRSHDNRRHDVKVKVKLRGHPFARVRYSTGFVDVDPRTLLVEHLATPADFPK
ncbi:MAG: VWA domain-containing protein, partial [Thermoanaerobaculia bacterium]